MKRMFGRTLPRPQKRAALDAEAEMTEQRKCAGVFILWNDLHFDSVQMHLG